MCGSALRGITRAWRLLNRRAEPFDLVEIQHQTACKTITCENDKTLDAVRLLMQSSNGQCKLCNQLRVVLTR